ncbi:MAG TPA: glutamate racemase [Henriciella marina]|uniref:glutamate racemase n=1 Tax=Henriciella sp. TaxID=1968823 RepID=UPI0018313F55|nr:glutamate racemase [Henriciella sp.]HIG24018.1 glutamate racemase [Henriciella sp.]HIK63405.1 glutamate racemase [Henriciella marina]
MTTPDQSMTQEMRDAQGRVLVFDSGMGGLTVAREICQMAPALQVDYAADTGFFPYGDKSDEALRARLPEVAEALVREAQPDVFVIACNTASTLALDEVRALLDIPVVGTVPAIKPAASLTKTGVIGLLATPGTIRRAYTAKLIEDFASEITVILHGSVELVRLAEAFAAGETYDAGGFTAALAPIFDAKDGDDVDTIVLACTHFPLVRAQLAAAAPDRVTFIDSGAAIARQTLRVLENAAPKPRSGEAGGRLYITDEGGDHARLVKVCARFGFERVCAPVLLAAER